jgi:NAD+ synthase (glutamine-hydrolysing)
LADPTANAAVIADQARAAARDGASLVVFPELSLTGYSLDDIFMQSVLLEQVRTALADLAGELAGLPAAIVVGAPLAATHRLYNCAVVIAGGRVLGAVPKSYLPNYREFYEQRQFAAGVGVDDAVEIGGQSVPVTTDQLFEVAFAPSAPPVRLGLEVCEDLWVPISPGAKAALAGAEVIANISGSPITVAKARERRRLAEVQSAKLICGYIYAASGQGESSTDLSWDGQTIIFERGERLAEGPRFSQQPVLTAADLDLALIRQDRLRQGTFDDNRVAHRDQLGQFRLAAVALPGARPAGGDLDDAAGSADGARLGASRPGRGGTFDDGAGRADGIGRTAGRSGRDGTLDSAAGRADGAGLAAAQRRTGGALRREIARFPFVPDDPDRLDQDCYEAYNIQVSALTRRLGAIGRPKIVIGVSGGLDSSHALIVAAKAVDQLGWPRSEILAYTLPGFATTEATKANATALARALGASFDEIDIRPAASQMLADLDHPFAAGRAEYDITFENVQAGLRTDYLFRLANHRGGLVLGTGDLSELALGWCTYGVGDQMSHYNVNGGVPKTLIQYLIRWVVKTGQFDESVGRVLQAIVDTEISPELVPPGDDGAIQSTQSVIGPYPLQDFALYYTLRFGLTPRQVFFRLVEAWGDASRGQWPAGVPAADRRGYSPAELLRWLEVFYQRFFSSQFKRSALPNGPKVLRAGSLSPRGDWRQPSDLPWTLWRRELDALRATL